MSESKKRIIFMGYSVGGAHSLRTLFELEAHVVGVILPKSAPSEKNAEVLGLTGDRIPVLYSNKPSKDTIEAVRNLRPDLIVVNSFPYLLPSDFIQVPVMGCVNLHGAYLPAYRGAHVLQWAIINGEVETGITLHYIDAGMDTGDIIAQSRIPILYEDTALTLRERMHDKGDTLLKDTWPLLMTGKAPRVKQDDIKASVFHKRHEEDSRIDWKKTSREIYNLVRALPSPWPHAYTEIEEVRLQIVEAREMRDMIGETPGRVIRVRSDYFDVSCGEGVIRVLRAKMGGVEIKNFNELLTVGILFN